MNTGRCLRASLAMFEGEPMGHLPSPEDGPQQLVEWPVTGLLKNPFGWRGEPLLAGAALPRTSLRRIRLPKIRERQARMWRHHSLERYYKEQFPYQSRVWGIALCFQREAV